MNIFNMIGDPAATLAILFLTAAAGCNPAAETKEPTGECINSDDPSCLMQGFDEMDIDEAEDAHDMDIQQAVDGGGGTGGVGGGQRFG